MNMVAFQEFSRIKNLIDKELDSSHYTNQVRHNLPALRKKYEQRGITNDDKITQLEIRANLSQQREINYFLELAKPYEISDKHKFLLMLTKPPKLEEKELWKQVRLPFPEIFIDVEFSSDDVNGAENKISGILIKELKSIDTTKDEKGNFKAHTVYGLTGYVSGINLNGHPFIDRFHYPILFEEEKEIRMIDTYYMNKKEAMFIKRFIINFILFLKDREVVWIESKRSQKNYDRRVKEGKIPLPSSRVIKLTGQLKRYINSLDDSDFKGKLTTRFWVSGHYRIYRSSRYKQMKGKVQWIEPYKKGEGIEVKQVRRIIPEENPDEFHYDDIKPSNRPLRDIKR